MDDPEISLRHFLIELEKLIGRAKASRDIPLHDLADSVRMLSDELDILVARNGYD